MTMMNNHQKQYIKHAFEPTGNYWQNKETCSYCSLFEDSLVHEMGDLLTDEEANSQMEDGLGSIPTIDITRAYLESSRSTLWGQAWDVKDKRRREEAARWLAREVDRINAIRNMAMSSSSPIELVVQRARNMEAGN